MTDDALTAIQSEFKTAYDNYLIADNILQRKISQRERQLEILKQKQKELNKTKPHWVERLIHPIIQLIKPHLPGWRCEDEDLLPLGLSRKLSVFFVREPRLKQFDQYAKENCIYIVFRPGNLSASEILYDTGETTNEYDQGTVGAFNGLNKRAKPLTSIDEAVQFLTSQIIDNENL